ncbi:hypothetical protein G7066_05800 [Leucobacter coleopterorum]|uniref:Uncharacterized protein n=1 Tax=Leucobacter coleopterorum TaxID=2714933 RepID=A0ABX6JVM5_9MICO|nr:hypothetical protein [Leucobacter coleopterorum]QIM18288.1 hypothetical protein G7066_05800 [Leucobacter coleopterorum]
MRNITSGTTRTVVFATILSSVLACLVLADLTTSESLVADAVKFQKSGASIITFSAPGRIDGDTCESLGAVPNVHSSGAIRSLDTGTKASALPSSTIPSFEVTAGFSELMGTKSSSASGAIISDAVADALGVSPGTKFKQRTIG